jgi:hypothetical protein
MSAKDFHPARQSAGGVGVEGPFPGLTGDHVPVAGLKLHCWPTATEKGNKQNNDQQTDHQRDCDQ